MSSPTGGPCKIRLISPNGARLVRICELGELARLVAEYRRDGYRLDAHELAIGGGKRTANPSRL